jgi:hypothetical protein
MRGQQVNILNILILRFLGTFLKCLWLKKLFYSQTGHVFFRRLYTHDFHMILTVPFYIFKETVVRSLPVLHGLFILSIVHSIV